MTRKQFDIILGTLEGLALCAAGVIVLLFIALASGCATTKTVKIQNERGPCRRKLAVCETELATHTCQEIEADCSDPIFGE